MFVIYKNGLHFGRRTSISINVLSVNGRVSVNNPISPIRRFPRSMALEQFFPGLTSLSMFTLSRMNSFSAEPLIVGLAAPIIEKQTLNSGMFHCFC